MLYRPKRKSFSKKIALRQMSEIDRRTRRIPLDKEYSGNDDDDELVDSDEEDGSESGAKRSSFIMNFDS